ncbi:Crp/Fnr family transcriptional regulator [Polaromonas sp. P2-4]|nr:Crp/Fnr family transcriptional regulator [Polaromonas sp. P2-4]
MLSNPWFGALPASLVEAMLALCEPLHLHPGQMALRQTEAANGFFGLVSGSLKASTLGEDGREAILAVIEPGNWFGEISLLDGRSRTHDVTALEASELLVLSPSDFAALMARGEFSRAISVLLAGRIRSLYWLVEDAALRSTRARVARRLLMLASGDLTMAENSRASVPVSQEALAMMLGITRQTLSKELKALVDEGAVALRYRRIEIMSVVRLKALAELR